MDELKGTGRVVASMIHGSRRVDLLYFVDGSWGIRRGGSSVSIWEPSEVQDCFATFVNLGGDAVSVTRIDMPNPLTARPEAHHYN